MPCNSLVECGASRHPVRLVPDTVDVAHAFRRSRTTRVGRTPRISCEAVPASILPARARGGTSVRTVVGNQPGAAESFVSFIRLLGGPLRLQEDSNLGDRLVQHWTGEAGVNMGAVSYWFGSYVGEGAA